MKQKIKLFLILFVISFVINANIYSQEIDKNRDNEIIWHSGEEFTIEGKGWNNTQSYYDRMPAESKKNVTPDVWGLSHQSAGLSLHFTTNASSIKIRWSLLSSSLGSSNMSPTGVSGIDVYYKDENEKLWFIKNCRPKSDTNTTTVQLPQAKEYILYLPLYNGVKSVEIGIPKGENIAATEIDEKRIEKTILFYGTSITQGGCASRPGMAFTSIVGRKLDVPVINLGFSGNGKMEIEMAEWLSELDPSVYVLDCLWNMKIEMVKERVEPFIIKLRELKPNTPIVLAEDCNFKNISPTPKGKIVRDIYNKLVSQGAEQLYFLSNEGMLGTDNEATVDGVHPNDLGMVRMSAIFSEFLKKISK